MGTDDKFDAKADELKGKVKEGVGDATDDEGLQTEGQTDQAKGHLKESVEKVKDTFKKDCPSHFPQERAPIVHAPADAFGVRRFGCRAAPRGPPTAGGTR